MLSGFPARGLCLRVTEVRIVHALLFPLYSLGRHSAKSSISLRYTLFPLCLFFLFFLQAAKLNYVRFEDRFCCSLLLDRLYNTFFVRLSVESFLVCNNVAAFLYGWCSASGSLPFIFFSLSVAGSDSMF
jgi:hypothetical protein